MLFPGRTRKRPRLVEILGLALLCGGLKTLAWADINVAGAAVSGENSLGLYDNQVTGPGAASSYLTHGFHFGDDVSLNADWTQGPDARWSSQLGARFTDDVRNDPKGASIERFSLDRYSAARHISLGDYYGNFTQYSLNQNIKGARWEEENVGGNQISAVAGVVQSRWDDLWLNNSNDALNRSVYGLQARRELPLGSELSAEYVGSSDQRLAAGAAADAFTQNLLGVGWALPSNSDLSVSGESAWSGTHVGHAAAAGEDRSGAAHRVSAQSRVGLWRSWNDFENVSPYFVTTVGAATPDFRRFQTRNTFRINPSYELLGNYSWYRNNLNHQGPDTAITQAPEAGLRWIAPFNRASLNLEARLRNQETSHSSAASPHHNSWSEILSASDRFGDVNADLQYEHRSDRTTGTQHDERDIVGLGLTGAAHWREMILRPSVRWDLDNQRDLILSGVDQTFGSQVGLAVDFTPELSGSVNYQISSIVNIGADTVQRNSFDLHFDYSIPRWKGDRVEVGYKDDINTFTTGSKNYTESVWETSYVHKL